jgi:hypothetical protein
MKDIRRLRRLLFFAVSQPSKRRSIGIDIWVVGGGMGWKGKGKEKAILENGKDI